MPNSESNDAVILTKPSPLVLGLVGFAALRARNMRRVSAWCKTRRRTMMPNWLGPLLALCALVGFIAFAVRQGTKVKPNADGNPDTSVGGPGGDT